MSRGRGRLYEDLREQNPCIPECTLLRGYSNSVLASWRADFPSSDQSKARIELSPVSLLETTDILLNQYISLTVSGCLVCPDLCV